MAPIEFTIDNLAFASSSLTASHKAAITNIARRLVEGSGGVSPIDEVQKIVLTGYASGTKNLEQHANRRAASVRKALEGCLRSFGAGPAQIAKIRLADPIVKKVATAAQSLGKDRKVVITILAGVAPERSTVDLDLAFVTQGDTRISIDNLDERFSPAGNHTKTEIYQLRAADLPKIFDKVALDDHGSYPRALKPESEFCRRSRTVWPAATRESGFFPASRAPASFPRRSRRCSRRRGGASFSSGPIETSTRSTSWESFAARHRLAKNSATGKSPTGSLD